MSKEFNVLKFNEDYEKMKKQKILDRKMKERNKLKKLNKTLVDKKLHDMSILEILIEFKNNIFGILDDLINFNFNDFNSFLNIFSKNNRLFFIGLMIIFITGIIYIFSQFNQNNTKNNKVNNIYYMYNKYY